MMTDGIISAVNEKITLNGYKTTLLQTNAELCDGSSGGALINHCGQVIGITNMKIVSSYLPTDGIGFALPVEIAKPIIEELLVNDYKAARRWDFAKDVPGRIRVLDLPSDVYVNMSGKQRRVQKGLRGDIIVSINVTLVSSETIF